MTPQNGNATRAAWRKRVHEVIFEADTSAGKAFDVALLWCIVLTLVLVVGTLMHLIEGEEHGFDSTPRSVYWAIVTLTTVGYGDIAPQTVIGQALASLVMILGYSIIAVPTGVVTVALSQVSRDKVSTQACPECSAEGHDTDAKFCKHCGAAL